MDSSIDASKLSDRELLLLMHERQGVMGGDVKELKEGTNSELTKLMMQVDSLKEQKADKLIVDRLERGQNRLFNWLWFLFGASTVLQVIVKYLLH